ncbi:hypothetical protein PENTCL1PPCAC_14039, partial [Pristionchus entomophagus]
TEKKCWDMEKIVKDGVCLFELITISRLAKGERAFRKKPDRDAREHLNKSEDTLSAALFAAMERDADEQNISHLKERIDAIRHEYAKFM